MSSTPSLQPEATDPHLPMAHRRSISHRLTALSRPQLLEHHTITLLPTSPSKTEHSRSYITSPDPTSNPTFFQRLFHRRSLYQSSSRLPELFSIPIGDKLRETLKRINSVSANDRIRFNELAPPAPSRISVDDARKILRLAQVEKMKLALRRIQKSAISYAEYVRLCVEECGDEEQGLEFSKLMDATGNVIVLGNTVFLCPDQVAKMVRTLIAESIPTRDDPRRAQLEQMEAELSAIDEKAMGLVRREMYSGLGFVILQTLGFMRLTFWELSWDVMEPICFFVTSMHFAAGYVFFLRTATEPSFEGLVRRRFEVRRRRLMAAHGFDLGKYEELRKVVYREGSG
uniref:Calcium uniporter protein C-terminal domain-containing protein n=1 Tax=Kalanchoe fedtschenkoi TaxID=63787 RepID=A0A7N0ZVQ2_KALFE